MKNILDSPFIRKQTHFHWEWVQAKMRPGKNKLTLLLECQSFQFLIPTFYCRAIATISSEITLYAGNVNDCVFFKRIQHWPSCPECQGSAYGEGEAHVEVSYILCLIIWEASWMSQNNIQLGQYIKNLMKLDNIFFWFHPCIFDVLVLKQQILQIMRNNLTIKMWSCTSISLSFFLGFLESKAP